MDKVNFVPADQRVLVLPTSSSGDKTPGGIFLPESHQEDKPQFGEVVRIGNGDSDNPMRYHIGDKVIFSKYAGIELSLNLDGIGLKDFKVMNQGDIMGTIKKVQ